MLHYDSQIRIIITANKRQITEKQLDAEHVNLNRVNDILSGLEDRVEPLREQSEKAKIYLELKDRQKTLDINSFLIEVDKIREKLDENQKNLDITEADTARLREEFDYTKAEYERLEASLEELNNKIEDLKSVINGKKLENEHSDGEIRVIMERISSEGVISAEINAQIERLNGRIDELNNRLKEFTDKKKSILDELKSKEAEAKRIDVERQSAEDSENEISGKINNAQADILEFINEGGNLKEKIARYDTMLENINLRKTELKSKLLADKSEQSQALMEEKTFEDDIKSINAALDKNRTRLSKCEAELRAVSDRGGTVKTEIQKYNQTIISLQSRYESLRNLTERYEGYGQSIKKVMEKKQGGTSLTVLGFGYGNYQDDRLQALANYGDGNCYFIDTIYEARKALVTEAGGTFDLVASDVKIQLDFNPSQVRGYRLIGYESKLLAAEDFANDEKDGGDIGSGQQMTALYEIVPVDSAFDFGAAESRYTKEAPMNNSAEWLTLSIRAKVPGQKESQLYTYPLLGLVAEEMSDDSRFAAAIAETCMCLRNNEYKGESSYANALTLLRDSHPTGDPYREEFLYLVTLLERAGK